jgi:hypothetical protein
MPTIGWIFAFEEYVFGTTDPRVRGLWFFNDLWKMEIGRGGTTSHLGAVTCSSLKTKPVL